MCVTLLSFFELRGVTHARRNFVVVVVVSPAWIRLERKIKSLGIVVSEARHRKLARGDQPPDSSKRSGPIKPIAQFTKEGTLMWDEEIQQRILILGGRDKETRNN